MSANGHAADEQPVRFDLLTENLRILEQEFAQPPQLEAG